MVHRRRRALALLSVFGVLASAWMQAPRGCTVCPVGCPMHVARPQQPGCHHGRMTAPEADHGAQAQGCSVRASCGHLARFVTAAPAVMPAPAPLASVWRETRVEWPRRSAVLGAPPEPPTDPPRSLPV